MLLTAQGLTKIYRTPGAVFWGPPRLLTALDDVSLSIDAGETVGILGASGCGKTTLAHLVCRVINPTRGHIAYGPAIADPRQDIQLIAQNPYDAFDPSLTIGASLEEPLLIHGMKRGRHARMRKALEDVCLDADICGQRPNALSGGQRQRAALARALACAPKLLVCDEPTSALDLSVQADILGLLAALKARRGLSVLFISHDMEIIRHVSDRICVLDSGIIVETGKTEEVLARPRHPASRGLTGDGSAPTLI